MYVESSSIQRLFILEFYGNGDKDDTIDMYCICGTCLSLLHSCVHMCVLLVLVWIWPEYIRFYRSGCNFCFSSTSVSPEGQGHPLHTIPGQEGAGEHGNPPWPLRVM